MRPWRPETCWAGAQPSAFPRPRPRLMIWEGGDGGDGVGLGGEFSGRPWRFKGHSIIKCDVGVEEDQLAPLYFKKCCGASYGQRVVTGSSDATAMFTQLAAVLQNAGEFNLLAALSSKLHLPVIKEIVFIEKPFSNSQTQI